nr:hypothetical protein [Desulfobulbaceae bacterium]
MKIRNKKTYFSSMPEGQAPYNPSRKLSSTIYFIALSAIVAYLIFYGTTRILYLEARGQVEVGRYLIHANLDGTINKILVSQGDTVSSGQSLVNILQPTNKPSVAKDLLKTNLDINQKEADLQLLKSSFKTLSVQQSSTSDQTILPVSIIDIDNDIRIKQARLFQLEQQAKIDPSPNLAAPINDNQRLLELSRNDRSQLTKLMQEKQVISLAADSLKMEIDSLKRYRDELLAAEQQKLALKIASLKGDVRLLQNYLASLEQEGNQISTIAEQLVAPINGQVQAIFKLAGEQTSIGEAILALRSPESRVAVHGYFREDQINHLTKDKRVKITFADHSSSTGIISNHYSIASSYREKLKDEYIPIQSAVLVEILPANPNDEERWRNFDRLDVTIKVKR